MSLLDLDERIVDLLALVDLVYSPVADIKKFPEGVDVTLVEGACCNSDNIHMAREIRLKSKQVVSFGDCAITGNVPGMRNRLKVENILSEVYADGPGPAPPAQGGLPVLLAKVLPLHQVIPVDVYLPGCPPSPERIWLAVTAMLKGEPVELPAEMRTLG